jgi:hypothetical protein
MQKAQYLLKPLFFPKIIITTDTGGDIIVAATAVYSTTGSRTLFKNRDFAENVQS